MLAQNVSAQRRSDSSQSDLAVTQDAGRRDAALEQPRETNLVVLDENLKVGTKIERQEEAERFSPRLSIAVIAGLSVLLWLLLVAFVF